MSNKNTKNIEMVTDQDTQESLDRYAIQDEAPVQEQPEEQPAEEVDTTASAKRTPPGYYAGEYAKASTRDY